MTIAIDFDGTIVEHRYPQIGRERPFAFDTLKRLQKDGHKLILWTVREGKYLQEAIDFCKENGVEFYAVNSDGPLTKFEGASISRKLRADMFIDDRNLGGIPDWPTAYTMISRRLNFSDLIENEDALQEKNSERRNIFKRIADRCKSSRKKLGGISNSKSRRYW